MQVANGDVECAVTGRGFTRMVEGRDVGMLRPVLQRAAVFARMSPDNKRDLCQVGGRRRGGGLQCHHHQLGCSCMPADFLAAGILGVAAGELVVWRWWQQPG
jgi:hypothetical protein